MIEVFKTNVARTPEARAIVRELRGHFPDAKVNFDLSDCDKILRIEHPDVDVTKTVSLLVQRGYQCEVIP